MKFHLEQGQSLLEITVTLGAASLIITAIVIVTIIGLKNSQFAQNQAQATKLAQEGIEKVKAMRDRNDPICLNPSDQNPRYWVQNSPLIWDPPGITIGNPNFIFTNGICKLGPSNIPEDIAPIFRRTVTLDTQTVNQIQVHSKVSWTDFSGMHISDIATILTNY